MLDSENNNFEDYNSNIESTPKLEQKNSLKESIHSFAVTLVVVLAIVLPIRAYIAKPFIVKGSSMDPTFETWDYLIVDEATYNFRKDPERGDVVIFKAPTAKGTYYIKRIIGLPGETVKIINGQVVIINDKFKEGYSLDEPYISNKNKSYKNIELKLKDDEYFVMGDNRAGSYDSRVWGPLKREAIVGRAFVRFHPFNLLDLFPGKYRYLNN